MRRSDLNPGDEVVYLDKDRARWGPWTVVEVAGDEVTVMVNERISYSIRADLIRKAARRKAVV